MERLAVVFAEGFTGMTILQELASIASELPFKEICAVIEINRVAEGKEISQMHSKFVNVFYDASDIESLEKCLKDVDAFILTPPAQPLKQDFTMKSLELLKSSKLGILISSVGADLEKPLFKEFLGLEMEFMKLNCKKCILRLGFYSQNLLLFTEEIRKGELNLPIGNNKLSMLDLIDVGIFIAKLLPGMVEKNDYNDKTFVLAGLEEFSGTEISEVLSNQLGMTVKFHDISHNECKKMLFSTNVIDNYEAVYLLEYFDLVKHGQLRDVLSTDFLQITGDNHTKFSDFILKYKKELITGEIEE